MESFGCEAIVVCRRETLDNSQVKSSQEIVKSQPILQVLAGPRAALVVPLVYQHRLHEPGLSTARCAAA